MKRVSSRLTRLLVAGMASLVLASPALAQDQAVLRVSTPFDEAAGLDPLRSQGFFYVYGVSELLMQFREDGHFHPWLLESAENTDDFTWVLKLRPGITFQNGKALDAAAVVGCLEYQMTNSSAAQGAFPAGIAFEATGPLDITVKTPTAFPALPGLLADRNVYSIFDVEAVEAAAGDWAQLADDGIYTGPYAVASIDAEHVMLDRHEGYWQGMPAMAGVDVQFIRDTNASVLAVQNGEIDIALFMPVSVRPVVEASPAMHFAYRPSEGLVDQAYQLFLNVGQEPFTDPAVRQAIVKAIDYDEISNTVFGGVHGLATGFYGSLYDYALKNQATDLAGATALLDAAGWVPGGDGIREKDGQRLELDIVFNPGVADLVTMGAALQDQLREAGIGVVITTADDTAAALSSRPWGASMFRNSLAGIPELFLHRFMTADGDRNFAGYANAEFEAAVDELAQTIDETRRTELLHRIQEIAVVEDPYVVVLAFSQAPAVTGAGFHHYVPGFFFQHINWQTAPQD